MKLITEIADVEFVTEATDDGLSKNYYIEGIFMQADVKNRNGRIYPVKVLGEEVERYSKEYVKDHRAYGELGHPSGPTINLDRVSHIITDLRLEGNNVYGKAKIVGTPNGEIVKRLMDEGAKLGVSSRGMGSLQQRDGVNVVQSDFKLSTAADIVADPSAPNAFVQGIMEGVEWLYDEKRGWIAQEIKEEIVKMSLKELEEQKLAFFKRYLTGL